MMADEYIKREDAIVAYEKASINTERLKAIPAADVRPVVRGRWEWDDDGMDWGIGSWRCSQCHTRPETTWQTMKDIIPLQWCGSKFCPNCGADMRGTDNG